MVILNRLLESYCYVKAKTWFLYCEGHHKSLKKYLKLQDLRGKRKYVASEGIWNAWFYKRWISFHPKDIIGWHLSEAIPQRCSSKKVFAKDATSLQENTNAEVYFQKSCFAEYFFLKTLLGDCFWCFYKETLHFLYPLWCYTHEWLSITKI